MAARVRCTSNLHHGLILSHCHPSCRAQTRSDTHSIDEQSAAQQRLTATKRAEVFDTRQGPPGTSIMHWKRAIVHSAPEQNTLATPNDSISVGLT
jgi:hypothetical protein